MSPLKIVLVYASSGAGHQKAAEALHKALQGRPDLTVRRIDSLDYTTPPFRFFYPRIYLFLVRHLPDIWGFFYDGLNVTGIGPFLRFLRRRVNTLNGKALERFFLSEKPDVIASTHFFAGEVISSLKKRGRLEARLLTVVTDFVIHSVWITPETDGYIVGSPDTREALIRRNVPQEKITCLGIPVDPLFEKEEDRRALAQKLGVSPEAFTILVVSGGFGVGPIGKLVMRLSENPRLQLLVVCGHNQRLYERLASRTAPVRERVRLYGFVNNIHELMSVSDCMVGKSGGLSMSEALAKALPVFTFSPIPGQEKGNRDLLLRHGAVLSVRSVGELARSFSDLDRLRKDLEEVRRRILRFRQRHTAERIAAHLVSQGGEA